jgi:hypothetical protein
MTGIWDINFCDVCWGLFYDTVTKRSTQLFGQSESWNAPFVICIEILKHQITIPQGVITSNKVL